MFAGIAMGFLLLAMILDVVDQVQTKHTVHFSIIYAAGAFMILSLFRRQKPK